MNYMFPYHLVEQGSKIILYGEGKVGKEFYLQLHYNKYCVVEAWVDKVFDHFETNKPFDKVANIGKYDFDYVVIAIADLAQANSIKQKLVNDGIETEKIIWSRSYMIDSDIFPDNRKMYLTNWNFYEELIDDYVQIEQWFLGSGWYQGNSQISINGARNSGERIIRYRILDYLTKDSDCLDIGCNCGFFDIELAKFVNSVVGIDIEERFIDLANKVKEFQKKDNVSFVAGNFMELKENAYDAVFSFAVHRYIFDSGITMEQYTSKLFNLIRDNGFLFIESHGMESDRVDFPKVCKMFEESGMKVLYHGQSRADVNRELVVFRK